MERVESGFRAEDTDSGDESPRKRGFGAIRLPHMTVVDIPVQGGCCGV